MNYSAIRNFDMVNGTGLRVTLFVSGCSHKCPGCYNKETWNPKNGERYTHDVETRIIGMLRHPTIRGLSLSGGDPLYRDNLNVIENLINRVRKELPEKDIWLWTGYKFEDLDEQRCRIVSKVNVLIDGRYEKDKPTQKPFRGSDNQRLIEIKNVR